MVDVAEAPVVMVVSGSAIRGEILTRSASVVNIGHKELANFVSVFKKNIDAVVVLDELVDSSSEGIGLFSTLVDPMT